MGLTNTPTSPRHLCLLALVAAVLIGQSSSALIEQDLATYPGCVRTCIPQKDNSVFSFFGNRATTTTTTTDKLSVEFEQGKTYQYRVEISNQVLNKPMIGIKAQALITPLSQCELSMQLRQVEIEHMTERDESVQQLISQLQIPILFGYQNGVVTELCADSDDHWYATNLKKSIISSLQTTPDLTQQRQKIVEPDFHGECETKYEVLSDPSQYGKLLILKQKNLHKCSKSEYPTEYQDQTNFFDHNSTLTCRQVVDNRRLSNVECVGERSMENLMFGSNIHHHDHHHNHEDHHHKNGVKLISRVNLKLENTVDSEKLSARFPKRWERHSHLLMMTRPTSRMHYFQNKRTVLEDGQNELTTLLREICTDIDRNSGRVGRNTPEYVQRLAELLEQVKRDQVQFVWKNLVEKNIVCEVNKPEVNKKLRDIFVDTAASVMNQNTVPVIIDEMTRYEREISEHRTPEIKVGRSRYLATLLAFAANPTSEAVQEVVTELLTKTEDSHIVLSVSGLVRKTRSQLDSTFLEQTFDTVLQKINRMLGRVTEENDVDVLRLLKALENIAPKTSITAQDLLIQIFNNKRMPVSVRFGAIRAIEAVRISEKARQSLMNLFVDRHEPNEIRIAAYRTLVLNEVTVEELKQMLEIVEQEQESNLDVYNYVCSHQKNLRTTQDMHRRTLLPLEAPLFPEPKSMTNFLLSRNFEFNFVNTKTAVGPLVEADILMAKESRIPRYLSLNLTVPVADKSIPIVELTIRQQGLDRSIMERLEKMRQLIQNPMAALRELRKIVREQQQQQTRYTGKDAKLQIFFNIDGKNVFIWDSVESKTEQDESVTGFWQQLTKHLPISWDETTVLMPFRHRVQLPTASGIPVTFHLNTTLIASLDSKITGHSQQDNSLLELLLKPTFVMEFGVGLEADLPTLVKSKRVQFVNRFITAPTLNLKTELKDGKHLRVKLLLPEQEQTIARFETKLIEGGEQEYNRYDTPTNSLSKRVILNKRNIDDSELERQQEKCSKTMERMFGFTFCTKHFSNVDLDKLAQLEQQTESKKFIYESEITLKKTDQQMEGVELTIELPQLTNDQNEFKFVLLFNTPNSEVSRRFATELLIRLPTTTTEQDQKYEIQIQVESPIHKYSGQIMLLNRPNEKAFRIELLSDRKQRQFFLELGTLMEFEDRSNGRMKLQLHLQPTERSELLEMEGEIVLNQKSNGKTNFELKLDAQQKNILLVTMVKSGELFEQTDYKMATNVKLNAMGVKLDTSLLTTKDQQTGTLKSTGQIKYNHFWTVRRTDKLESVDYLFQLSGFGENAEKLPEIKKFVHWSISATQLEVIGHELTYHITGDRSKQINQQLSLKFSNKQKEIRLTHQTRVLQDPRTRNSAKFDTKVELECVGTEPKFACHHTLNMILDVQPANKRYSVDLTLNNEKSGLVTLESHFSYVLTKENPMTLESKAEIKLLNAKYYWQFQDQMREIETGVIAGKTMIDMPEAEQIARYLPEKIEMTYQYRSNDNQQAIGTQLDSEKNIVRQLVKRLAEFEHELVLHFVNQEDRQKVRHLGSIKVDHSENQFPLTLKSKLEELDTHHHQTPVVYDFEMNLIPAERELTIKLETNRIYRTKVNFETKLKDLYRLNFDVECEQFRHQTKIECNPRENLYQFDIMVEPNQKSSRRSSPFADFRISAQKTEKLIEMKTKSSFLMGEIRFENVPQMFRAIIERRQAKNEANVKIEFQIPSIELEHQTEINCKSNDNCQLQSQTKRNQMNLLRLVGKMNENERSLEAEYLVGYLATAKINQIGESRYELVMEGRNEPRHWSHQTNARWQYKPAAYLKKTNTFNVESFQTKNHLGDRSLFDLTYQRYEEENTNQRYQHKLILSTQMTNAELSFSSRFFDSNSDQPKALFTVRSKRFDGIEHHTEIVKFNRNNMELALNSKTARSGLELINIECDVVLSVKNQEEENHRESIVKISMQQKKHQIEIRFVPNKMFRCEWIEPERKHLARFERQTPKQWVLEIESDDTSLDNKWNLQMQHKCDDYTRIQIESPIVRGRAELELNNQRDVQSKRNLRIKLDGVGRYSQYSHNTDAMLELDSDKPHQLTLQSVTKQSGKPYVNVDAEINLVNLERQSTIKMQIVPAEFKLELECEPRVGGEIRFQLGQYKYQAEMRHHRNQRQLITKIEAKDDMRNLFKLESKFENNGRILKLVIDSDLERFPIAANLKYNVIEREIEAEFNQKQSGRFMKLRAMLADPRKCLIEFAWDVRRDPTKTISIELSIQEEKVDRNRFVMSLNGQLVGRRFVMKFDIDRNELTRGSHQISGQYINRDQEQYQIKYQHLYQSEQKKCQSEFTLKKNDFKLIKLNFELDINQPERKLIKLESVSDYHQMELLNLSAEFIRECDRGMLKCLTKTSVNYGNQKQAKLELTNDRDTIRGEILLDYPQLIQKQTVKFEWIKAESKLQINVYNQAGRQLDFNVDLVGKPLQKKFQIVSFIESIPTVNIEAEYGENSRIVFELSFKEEKKAELSLNWYGQWRRDFELQALFKLITSPSIELMVTSKHPAGGDRIEAMLHFQNKQYSGKWNRKFDESRKSWTTQALLNGPDGKMMELNLERSERKMDNIRDIVIYRAQLDGKMTEKPLDLQLEVVMRPQERSTIEMIRFECEHRNQEKLFSVEMYYGSQEKEQSAIRTGLRMLVNDRILFGAIHTTSAERLDSRNRRFNLIHIELPSEIEYMLRNEIEYQPEDQQKIRSIRSELKRKGESVEPIYQTRVMFEKDQVNNDQIVRIKINSVHFRTNTPKVFELRYNFRPEECRPIVSNVQEEQSDREEIIENGRCWRVQLVAGEMEQSNDNQMIATKQIQNGIKFAAQYLRNRIQNDHFNRTIRLSIESINKSSPKTLLPINFSMIGHASVYSAGLQYDNLNRYGKASSGMVYLNARPNSLVQFVVADLNRHQPSKDVRFAFGFDPKNVRKTLNVDTKWDQDRMRSWLVGELPRLHQLSSQSGAQIRSRFGRELRAEMRNKIRALRQTFDDELMSPIVDEATNIQKKLKTSEEEVSVNLAKYFDEIAREIEQFGKKIEFEQLMDRLSELISRQMEQLLRMLRQKTSQMEEQMLKQCEKVDFCRKIFDQLRDYEINKFVKQTVDQLTRKLESSLRNNIPEQVRETMGELRHQLIEHPVDDCPEEDYYEDHKHLPHYNRIQHSQIHHNIVKHGIRLLKMSQPTLVDHLTNIVKEMTKSGSESNTNNNNQYQTQQSQQQEPINWQSVRGSMHDMAVDVIDQMQPKTKDSAHHHQQQSSSFLEKLGLSSHNQQQEQQEDNNYSKTSPYDYMGNQNNNNLTSGRNLKKNITEEEETQNYVFSPKRAQFKILPNLGQFENNDDSTIKSAGGYNYWTRA